MSKEGDPTLDGQSLYNVINETFEMVFEHPYWACRQLSKIPGELGKIHQEHLQYFEKIIKGDCSDEK